MGLLFYTMIVITCTVVWHKRKQQTLGVPVYTWYETNRCVTSHWDLGRQPARFDQDETASWHSKPILG